VQGSVVSASERGLPRVVDTSRFPTESACAQYLFERRCPIGFVCRGCGGGRAWLLKAKAFTYECADWQTSVTAGTILHASKLPLTVWFVSIRSKPQVRLFDQFDLRRCAAGSSFIGDDLLQVFDAVTCEGGHAILADAIDPKAAILREHVARKGRRASLRPRRAGWRRRRS